MNRTGQFPYLRVQGSFLDFEEALGFAKAELSSTIMIADTAGVPIYKRRSDLDDKRYVITAVYYGLQLIWMFGVGDEIVIDQEGLEIEEPEVGSPYFSGFCHYSRVLDQNNKTDITNVNFSDKSGWEMERFMPTNECLEAFAGKLNKTYQNVPRLSVLTNLASGFSNGVYAQNNVAIGPDVGEFEDQAQFDPIPFRQPGEFFVAAQTNSVRPCNYTGGMAKLVSLLLGYGRWDYANWDMDREFLKPDLIADGCQVQYQASWVRVHGLTRSTSGNWWIVEISERLGVVAFPMRFIEVPPFTPFTYYKYPINEFGGYPDNYVLPYDAAQVAQLIADGEAIELMSAAAYQSQFYNDADSWGDGTEWAFNDEGTEARVCAREDKDWNGYPNVRHANYYRMDISINDSNPASPSGSASITEIQSRALLWPMIDNWDGDPNKCRFNYGLNGMNGGYFFPANRSSVAASRGAEMVTPTDNFANTGNPHSTAFKNLVNAEYSGSKLSAVVWVAWINGRWEEAEIHISNQANTDPSDRGSFTGGTPPYTTEWETRFWPWQNTYPFYPNRAIGGDLYWFPDQPAGHEPPVQITTTSFPGFGWTGLSSNFEIRRGFTTYLSAPAPQTVFAQDSIRFEGAPSGESITLTTTAYIYNFTWRETTGLSSTISSFTQLAIGDIQAGSSLILVPENRSAYLLAYRENDFREIIQNEHAGCMRPESPLGREFHGVRSPFGSIVNPGDTTVTWTNPLGGGSSSQNLLTMPTYTAGNFPNTSSNTDEPDIIEYANDYWTGSNQGDRMLSFTGATTKSVTYLNVNGPPPDWGPPTLGDFVNNDGFPAFPVVVQPAFSYDINVGITSTTETYERLPPWTFGLGAEKDAGNGPNENYWWHAGFLPSSTVGGSGATYSSPISITETRYEDVTGANAVSVSDQVGGATQGVPGQPIINHTVYLVANRIPGGNPITLLTLFESGPNVENSENLRSWASAWSSAFAGRYDSNDREHNYRRPLFTCQTAQWGKEGMIYTLMDEEFQSGGDDAASLEQMITYGLTSNGTHVPLPAIQKDSREYRALTFIGYNDQ